ncbi:MAG: hypothetical protein HOV87_14975 [Catenulispora sp.]|nr:hypothetical protein [Catenulispora sp.]
MTDPLDARALNWRFVLPEAAGQLILASHRETLPGAVTASLADARTDPRSAAAFLKSAIAEGPYESVVVADLSGWSTVLRTRPEQLLKRLAGAVQPAGALFAAFGNRHYPASPFAAGTLSLKAASAALSSAGFTVTNQYIAIPDQRCPALLIPVSASGAELAYVLQNILFPYTDSTSKLKGRLKQILLSTMQHGAQAVPPMLRFRLAPAYAVVGVRPALPRAVIPPARRAEPPDSP